MASNDCVFCRIVSGEIPTEKLYADALVTAFRDHQPAAPSHVLIVPNQHLDDVNALTMERSDLAARLLTAAAEIAKQEGITESGYRLIMNTGPDGRQEVMHLHLHLLGGQRMQHPIG